MNTRRASTMFLDDNGCYRYCQSQSQLCSCKDYIVPLFHVGGTQKKINIIVVATKTSKRVS